MTEQEFYRSAVYHALSGYIYCRSVADQEGKLADLEIIEANPSFAAMFKVDLNKIAGRRISDVFSPMQREVSFLLNIMKRASTSKPLRLRTYFRPHRRIYRVAINMPQAEHYVIHMIDASHLIQRHKSERFLKRQLTNEELLFNTAMLAMQNTSPDRFYDGCLAMIGEKLGLSRVYIFEFNAEEQTIDNTYEWAAPGISLQKRNLQGIKVADIPWWHQTLLERQNIQCRDIEDIPEDTSRAMLREQGIKSLLAMPLFIDTTYFGFVGFDHCLRYCDWNSEDVRLLGSICNIFADYTKHRQTEAALYLERAQLLSLFDSIQEPIYVADMDSYEIIYANLAVQRVYSQNLVGDVCYKVLMNRDQPCDFCTNSTLKALAYEPYVWEQHNPVLNRYYRVVDRMIKWPDGRDVRFEMAIDISDHKQATRDLQTEKERLRVTLHSIGDGVISTNQEGTVLMMNEVAEALTGWWREEALGLPLSKVFRIYDEHSHLPQPDPVVQAMQAMTRRAIPINQVMLLDRNGRERPVDYSASPIKDISDDVLGVVLVFRDVTQQKKEAAEIFYLSYHDRLTGLYNRAFFERELVRLNTLRQLPLSMIMGDVNGLKITNDVFGHQEGDNLLRAIAQLLKESCREEDIIARWGGDEFIILLPQTSGEAAHEICERITRVCRDSSYGHTRVSISLGYSTKEKPEEDIMQVLRQAEDYMYKRKLLEGKSTRSSIVGSIKQTLYERGVESEQHTHRLSLLGTQIGRAMGLSDNAINELELLAMLHDIGKIAISDHILKKTSILTPEESQELNRHTDIGYRIAQSVPELAPIAECILSHHEWWNGQGYPQGLQGEAIPLPSRIISVVAVYDNLINGSPAQPGLPPQKALRVIAAAAGQQFDPAIVDIFMKQMGAG
jgi:diguanylate cyclase (GGDEF)-like protein/PAS domain S-box-containing protein